MLPGDRESRRGREEQEQEQEQGDGEVWEEEKREKQEMPKGPIRKPSHWSVGPSVVSWWSISPGD